MTLTEVSHGPAFLLSVSSGFSLPPRGISALGMFSPWHLGHDPCTSCCCKLVVESPAPWDSPQHRGCSLRHHCGFVPGLGEKQPKLCDGLFGLIGFLFQIIIACMSSQAIFPGSWQLICLSIHHHGQGVGPGEPVGGTQISLIYF